MQQDFAFVKVRTEHIRVRSGALRIRPLTALQEPRAGLGNGPQTHITLPILLLLALLKRRIDIVAKQSLRLGATGLVARFASFARPVWLRIAFRVARLRR